MVQTKGSEPEASVSFDDGLGEKLEVRMLGWRCKPEVAALRLTTVTAETPTHPRASIMATLCSLDLPVKHASVCRVVGMTVQDI